MKIKINNLHILNSLFAKLMAGFLLVIFVASSFHIFSYRLYVNNIKAEIISNKNVHLDRIVNIFEGYLNETKKMLVHLTLQKNFQRILNKSHITSYDMKTLVYETSAYAHEFTFYSSFFIFTSKSDYVITPSCTYDKSAFFNTFYNSPGYTQEFWEGEMKKSLNYKVYAGAFFEHMAYSNSTKSYLVPIAFKDSTRDDLILVILADLDALARSIVGTYIDGLYITNNNGELIYAENPDETMSLQFTGSRLRHDKTGRELLLSRALTESSLKYYMQLDDKLIKKQLVTSSLLYLLILCISLLVSMMISIYIVIRVNNPVKQISSLIDKSNMGSRSGDLKSIRDYIQKIDAKNAAYKEEISSQNSVLQAFFYHTRIKNIYSYISQLKDQISIKSDYFIAYFKLHYKKRYYDEAFMDSCKGTYYLKEYIELEIGKCFEKSVTFNLEDDQIVSIVNVADKTENIGQKLQNIIDILKSEQDYLVFTVVVSNIYENISDLNIAFDNLVKIARHRHITEEMQLVEEAHFKFRNTKIYFSPEQGKKLTDLLCSGKTDQSIGLMDDILDYNYKKGIDAFYAGMLCKELINCCVKCLENIYYNTPEEIDANRLYAELDRCITIEDYKDICTGFAFSVSEYINTHKQQKDYIIDYVKEYVDKHYNEDIYLELLAGNLNITKAYLSLYFKNKTGTNLSDYLRNHRMQKAKDLLENTPAKVHDISNAVGIFNVNTFIRQFREYTGETPGEYRKNRIE